MRVKIVKGKSGPPTMGGYKVYINEEYRGSSPTKNGARRLAIDIQNRIKRISAIK